jgi:hypothetical protein
MIHLATTHFNVADWVERQHRYCSRHILAPFKVYAAVRGIPNPLLFHFHRYIPAVDSHAQNLNALARLVLDEADPDDTLLFLDSDAFPIARLDTFLEKKLQSYQLIAVRRLENWYDPFPHPLFCAMKVQTWRELDGDWSEGEYDNCFGRTADVGGALYSAIEKRALDWYGLRKTNRFVHGPLFSIYDNLIYHHGAGSRPIQSRYDRALAGLCGCPLNLKGRPPVQAKRPMRRLRSAKQSNARASRRILNLIDSGQPFVERLAEIPATKSHLWAAGSKEGAQAQVRTLIVLGMHRSGTSFAAQLAHACGASLPPDLHAASPWNTRGNHESRAVIRLNDALLAGARGAWNRPPQSLKFRRPVSFWIPLLLRRLQWSGPPPIVLKDPRFVLTLPAWSKTISHPGYLIVFRSPIAVALSLQARNRIPIEQGLELWLKYNKRLIAYYHLLNAPIACLNFDAVEQSIPSVERLFRRAGLSVSVADRLHATLVEDFKHVKHAEVPASCRIVYADLLQIWKDSMER